MYGKFRTFAGRSLNDRPFHYRGQYEDSKTGLYYNRFLYYSPDEGMYISQDPTELNSRVMEQGLVKGILFKEKRILGITMMQ
ncbi:RHS repeat-associated core domain-containing protein [Prevotella nigrescens]|uniref:RHS repeat-associated core domain-containing protein n=1 Tax=Prevotella nigrescens TaxID=28133 RepID=UPI00360DECEE